MRIGRVLGLGTVRVAEHTDACDVGDPPGFVHLAHACEGVTGLTVIGIEIVLRMAEQTVAIGRIVILREGVLTFGRRSSSLVAEQAELVPPAFVAFRVGYQRRGAVAH